MIEAREMFQKRRKNRVAEYLFNSVTRYDQLHAANAESGKQVFTDVLTGVIAGAHVGREHLGYGSYLVVEELAEDSNVVIKKLNTQSPHVARDPEKIWDKFQREHTLVERYFGRRFVPYTEFITFEGVFPASDTQASPEKQYLMVQERIEGHAFDRDVAAYGRVRPLNRVSQEMKDETAVFINRYEEMLRRESVVIEDQIMIDFIGSTIAISDTNTLLTPQRLLEEAKGFFIQLGVDSPPANTTSEVLAIFQQYLETCKNFGSKTYKEVCDDLSLNGSSRALIEREISTRYGQRAVGGFGRLCTMIRHFPPAGEHNAFIDALMTQFGVTDIDLTRVG